jgi:hypothetical protein
MHLQLNVVNGRAGFPNHGGWANLSLKSKWNCSLGPRTFVSRPAGAITTACIRLTACSGRFGATTHSLDPARKLGLSEPGWGNL